MRVSTAVRVQEVERGREIPTARQVLRPAPGTSDQVQREREQRFFDTLQLANGTRKTTYENRLTDLNALIRDHLPAGRSLMLMDVGISSGISTAEWANELESAGVRFHLLGTDMALFGRLMSVAGRLHALLDSRGRMLQYEVNGRAVPYPAGPRAWLRYGFALSAIHASAWWLRRRRSTFLLRGVLRADEVTLTTKSVVFPRSIELVEHDLFGPPLGTNEFDVIRAANILNRVYFSADLLASVVGRLYDQLAIGGMLAVCRTGSDNRNNASLFRRTEHGVEVIARIGRGSEIEPLVLSLFDGGDAATGRPPQRTVQAAPRP